MQMRQSFKLILITSLLKISTLAKVTVIVGSQMAYLSAISCVAPLVGTFTSLGMMLSIFGGLALAKYIWLGVFPAHYLAYHIPGFCAALFWARPGWRLGIIIPVLCFLAFVVHPVGASAWVYTLYWLLPIGISVAPFVPSKMRSICSEGPFLKSLSATFVAHAVGSVIWLYTVPMTAQLWIGLIPIVAIERFSFALAMTGIYYCAIAIRQFFNYKIIHYKFAFLNRG
jgi:hypothetical protein